VIIHQQGAHERIIYERLLQALDGKPVAAQRSLFPSTIELAAGDAVMLQELLPDLLQIGYTIEPFGHSAFVIQATPADVAPGNEKAVMEKLLEQYKHYSNDIRLTKREVLLRTMANQQAVKPGTPLTDKEMEKLVTDLFQCRQPNINPWGKPVFVEFRREQMEKMFQR
jgi:DNA mismatch repair protein MutL